MKIAVLTLPLFNNYGGILQAYAMMEILKKMGHEPKLLNIQSVNKERLLFYFFKKILFFSKYRNLVFPKQDFKMKDFIDRYIEPKTKKIFNTNQLLKYFKNNQFDAYIVGSDQIFRQMGTYGFRDIYSLSFIKDGIKLAYAASFGGSDFKGKKLEFHKANLQKFKAISVRENSAMEICSDMFDVFAVHVLDPTLLLDSEFYIKLFQDKFCDNSKIDVFAYILDSTTNKRDFINKFSELNDLNVEFIGDGNSSLTIIKPETWLYNIYKAKYVITDSFHGCVFSILFNKPFFCFLNENRGSDRFYSLLSMFGLEHRIVKDDVINKFDMNIDWSNVNSILNKKKVFSIDFLKKNLLK